MNPLRLLWRSLLLLIHTLSGAWISIRAQVQKHQPPDPERISRWSRQLLTILGIELECRGEAPHQAAMIVANHVSWLDIPMISSCTHAAFLSKEAIRRWPIVGWFAVSAGTVFIQRGKGEAKQVAEAIAERLNGDRQLAVFPEGRVTPPDTVERFFPRLFAAAIEAQVPVAPVAIIYLTEDGALDDSVSYLPERSFLGILMRILARKKTRAVITFCPLIEPQGHDRKGLAKASREAIIQALSGLQDGFVLDEGRDAGK